MVTVLEADRRAALPVAEKRGTDLRGFVLEPELEMPGGRAREIGDFAFDPDAGKALLEQIPRLAIQLADRERGCLTRVFHGREYKQPAGAFAENSMRVEWSV
jgi:hypothetical protein